MRQIAIYGKGGIGKSTVASHLSHALADRGLRVFQLGCDPKSDSTHALLTDYATPILDVLRAHDFDYDAVDPDAIVLRSPLPFASGGAVFCAEAGGPEPGVGCGGKGVIEAIETIRRLAIFEKLEVDVVIYDILGDVVCGGFSLPIRSGYAEEIYAVTSGELEALYQVTNVCSAIRRFAGRSGAKLGGLVVNLRGMKNEERITADFAALLGTRVIGQHPMSPLVKDCGGRSETVLRSHPESPEAARYRAMAEAVLENRDRVVPEEIRFEALYAWWVKYVD